MVETRNYTRFKSDSEELSVPVLALSQLSRAGTRSKKPYCPILRESGSIEQDADV